MSHVNPVSDLDRALARAVLCRGLKIGLRPPVAVTAEALLKRRGLHPLRRAARLLSAGAVAAAVENLGSLAPRDLDELRRSYAELFGHTLQGRVCPYGSEYGRRALLQQAHELADLAGFYLAFGLRLAEERKERPDHVACELEFLEFLSKKEAVALAGCEQEMLEVTRAAQARFLAEHLGRFGRAFARSLQREDEAGVYGALGRLFEAFLEDECRRLGVDLGPAVVELRSWDPDDAPMACASEEDLVSLGSGRPPGE